jgi:alpha-methylacyl-CoA racemase
MGPLAGIRIVEMAGIGPAPFCGMLLADLGATVISIDRLSASDLGFALERRFDFLNRGKRAVAIDLKHPDGTRAVLDLVRQADALIEGFRPGVMERLGLGPDACLKVNPRLVYGRMTGWGQNGPLSQRAGHDINYIALAGVLHAVGPKDGPPSVPLNLIGDFAGGAQYLSTGILAALIEARGSGRGQVVDAAMLDGASHLMTMHHGYLQGGIWTDVRGSNTVDGGAPYYTTYRTLDDKYVAVGAVEARFYRELIEGLGISGQELPDRDNPAQWPALHARLSEVFATRTRDDWAMHFMDSDACVSPVLDMTESRSHPQALARQTFFRRNEFSEPAPAPKFSRTASPVPPPPVLPRQDGMDALRDWGLSAEHIETLVATGVIGSPA